MAVRKANQEANRANDTWGYGAPAEGALATRLHRAEESAEFARGVTAVEHALEVVRVPQVGVELRRQPRCEQSNGAEGGGPSGTRLEGIDKLRREEQRGEDARPCTLPRVWDIHVRYVELPVRLTEAEPRVQHQHIN